MPKIYNDRARARIKRSVEQTERRRTRDIQQQARRSAASGQAFMCIANEDIAERSFGQAAIANGSSFDSSYFGSRTIEVFNAWTDVKQGDELIAIPCSLAGAGAEGIKFVVIHCCQTSGGTETEYTSAQSAAWARARYQGAGSPYDPWVLLGPVPSMLNYLSATVTQQLIQSAGEVYFPNVAADTYTSAIVHVTPAYGPGGIEDDPAEYDLYVVKNTDQNNMPTTLGNSITWDATDPWTPGTSVQTPDIVDLVNETVNDPGYTNGIALIISPKPGNASGTIPGPDGFGFVRYPSRALQPGGRLILGT